MFNKVDKITITIDFAYPANSSVETECSIYGQGRSTLSAPYFRELTEMLTNVSDSEFPGMVEHSSFGIKVGAV